MEITLFLIPYILSLAISLGVLIYTWRYRSVRGANAYIWYVAAQSIWICGYIFELFSPNLEGKIFWDKIQWLPSLLITIAFPAFAVQYTEIGLRRSRLLFGLSLIVPLLFLITLLTDNMHHLLYSNPYLDHTHIFSDLKYGFTGVFYIIAIYIYLVSFTGLGILIRRFVRPHHLYRRQIATVATGFFIPIFFAILTTVGVEFMPFRDVSPFTFAAGNLIVAWGLFRYHLFDIIPIARDLILENMDDLVVVLDKQNRIVDINSSALTAINKKSGEVIGQPVETALAKWPDLLKKFELPENVKTETVIYAGGMPYQYEVKSTLLYNKNGRFLGRFFVSRDISEHTKLKSQLQSLNEELEERVAIRTEELRQSAERYRAVVEHQTEFIVRWKPDRTRTFVNEAYCRYFDLTHEEAMTIDFMALIFEEDRHLVQEKISRLETGEVNSETEIHRVIKPDGSIGWNEWIDTAIRDEKGRVIEYQSVGRDITARKQNEDALRKLSHAVEQSNVSIVITDTSGTIEYVNPYFSELSGYTPEEAIGQNPRILQSGITDKKVYTDLWQTVTEGKEWQGEFCNKKKNGELYWESSSISPILDNTGIITHFVAVKTDITERKRTEETILKQLAFEELMTVTLTQFATCPHDEIDTRIQGALQRIAVFMKIERAFMVIINPEHRKTWSITHEWHMPDVPPLILARENLPFGTFPWAENQILAGRETRINTLDDYPPEASAILKQHQIDGTKSVLNVPVRGSESKISGCIGIQTYSYSKSWIEDDITRLKMVGDAIANLLERKRAEELLLKAYDTTLEGWAKALELRDKETEDHSRRVTELTVTLAQKLGIQDDELVHIRRGTILHDIGKMAIPDDILRKPGKLTIEERKIMEQHPVYSYELLSSIRFLEKALDIPYCHHEHWDGSGYPRGLKGEEIPLAARIFAIIDVWDAVQSDRPYNKAWKREDAIQLIEDGSGTHFDPHIVEIFLNFVKNTKL